MAVLSWTIPNISCQHCVRRITQALMAIPNVQAVNADVATKKVDVTYEGADTPAKVRTALEEIGYPPAG